MAKNQRIFAALGLLGLLASLPAMAQDLPPAPAPGVSPRVDAIRKAGVLRIAVLSNPPWLIENTTGSGPQWSGPAWVSAEAYAKGLGVKLQLVPVSQETKVPVLASNQVDITITPLIETPERDQVADFVIYTNNSLCLFGLASNPKFAAAKTVDDLNSPNFTIAYLVGGGNEDWAHQRFPKAKFLGVASTTEVAPIQEIEARRADAALINRLEWVPVGHKIKGLAVLPKQDNCQDSTEQAEPGGLAIAKNQPEFLAWLRAVEKVIYPKVHAAELAAIQTMH